MTNATCLYCGGSLILCRNDAKFCTQKCGTYYRRQAGKLPKNMADSGRFVRYSAKKVPLTVDGRAASSTNAATWSSWDSARRSSVGVGVGIVLGSGIGCIDLDHCIVDGVVAPWAQAVLDANRGTFTEVSMSGDGLHVFGFLAEGPGRNFRDGVRSIEVYSVGRYIALTGNRFEGSAAVLRPLVLPVL